MALLISIVALILSVTALVQEHRGVVRARMFEAIMFLQQQDIRSARRKMLALAERDDVGNYESWSEPDKEAAGIVAQSYSVLALLIKRRVVPVSVAEDWRQSILRTHVVLQRYLEHVREPNRMKAGYLQELDELARALDTGNWEPGWPSAERACSC